MFLKLKYPLKNTTLDLYIYYILVLAQTNPPTMQVDPGSIPGSGRSFEEGNGYPLQFAGLENFMDRGVWQATVHGVAESHMTEHAFMPKTGAAVKMPPKERPMTQ